MAAYRWGGSYILALWTAGVLGCAVDPAGLPAGDAGIRDDAGDVPDVGVDGGSTCTPSDEECNGLDDDCDRSIDEGLASDACDPVGNGCQNGTERCESGELTCVVESGPVEGTPCDGDDADFATEGVVTCTDGSLSCVGDCSPAAETCDTSDEDCDGTVDEGVCSAGTTSCSAFTVSQRSYLFCNDGSNPTPWSVARDYCASVGYEIARFDTPSQLDALRSELQRLARGWWTGAVTDVTTRPEIVNPSNWRWHGTADAVDLSLWGAAEPSGAGQCAVLSPAVDHKLDDTRCDLTRPILCAAPVAP